MRSEDERIRKIKQIARELSKLGGGVGGQCVGIQQRNVLKANLGLKCMKAVKEYEKEVINFFGEQTNDTKNLS